ncbi:unnamed protein product, partial [Thlaspi arvense]
MTRNVRRGGKIWVRIFPDKPVTVRPAETRMGSGKGSPEFWVAVVKPDIIADIITSIRNADMNRKGTVRIRSTNITESIVKILLREGFIENRISRPGLRIYSNSQRIPRILGGIGIVILSTSQGIMTHREARLKRIGREILCYIW